MGKSARQFVTLDGLRGIAALVVVIRHTQGIFGFSHDHHFLLPEGVLAVDFFFVLSGFVLAHAYDEKLRTGLTPLRFMAVRLIRLLPLYSLAAMIGALGAGLLPGNTGALGSAALALISLFFIPFPGRSMFPLNNPAWSLHFELVGNLLYGLLARWLDTALLTALVIFAGVLLAVAVSLGWWGFDSVGEPIQGGTQLVSYGAGLMRVAFSFFAGVLVYRVFQRARPKSRPWYPYLIAALLVAILAAFPGRAYQAAFELIAVLFVFPALVFFGASANPGQIFAKVFSGLGRASYAIYVLHVPVVRLIFENRWVHTAHFTWMVGAAFILATIVAALAVDKYYDHPIRNWLGPLLR